MLMICGIIFTCLSVVMRIWPPQTINMWYGYRTSLSMSSEKAWKLAQEHTTKALARYGIIMIIVGFLMKNFLQKDSYEHVGILMELIIFLPLFTILIIYSALSQKKTE